MSQKERNKTDIKCTQTFKFYPYMREKINQLVKTLNRILLKNFELDDANGSTILDTVLFAPHRDQFGGFNQSLSIEFLIHLFKIFKNDQSSIDNFIVPEMNNFFYKLSEIKINYPKKNETATKEKNKRFKI